MRRSSRSSFIVKVSPSCLWAHLCSPQFGFRLTTPGLLVRLPRTVVLYPVCGMQVLGHRNRRPWRARRKVCGETIRVYTRSPSTVRSAGLDSTAGGATRDLRPTPSSQNLDICLRQTYRESYFIGVINKSNRLESRSKPRR